LTEPAVYPPPQQYAPQYPPQYPAQYPTGYTEYPPM